MVPIHAMAQAGIVTGRYNRRYHPKMGARLLSAPQASETVVAHHLGLLQLHSVYPADREAVEALHSRNNGCGRMFE